MSIQKRNKINLLLKKWPIGTPAQTTWLNELGYSNQLLSIYKKSDWIEPIGTGAYKRPGDSITWEGAVSALQYQSNMNIHPAGPTALMIQGKLHYLKMAPGKVYIMGMSKESLPAWLKNHSWDQEIQYLSSSFLPPDLGIIEKEYSQYKLKISGAARAMLECLFMAPKYQDIIACYELMEGLSNLRPKVVQELLLKCKSIKVKRLFLYMAEKAGHSWFRFIKVDAIDLGRGKRSLVASGIYNSTYRITIPSELDNYGRI